MEIPKDGRCVNCGAMLEKIPTTGDILTVSGQCECAYCGTTYQISAQESVCAVSKSLAPEKAIALSKKADAAYSQGRYSEAIGYLTEALEFNPNDYSLWNLFGRAHRVSGNHDRARSCYQKALNLKPNASDVIANLGALELTCQNYQEAYRHCKQSFEAIYSPDGHNVSANDRAVRAANYALSIAKIGNKREAMRVADLAKKLGYTNYANLKKMIKES